MSSYTFSITNEMNEWIDAQIANGHYKNKNEYFLDLIKRDQSKIKSLEKNKVTDNTQ